MDSGAEILVAEDNELNRKVIEAYFEVLNVTYDIAEDGNEALSMLTTHRYDLALMDVRMPGMNGNEVVQAVRKMDEPHPWFVAVTAGSADETNERYSEAGFDEHLPKPLRIGDVEALLARRRNSIERLVVANDAHGGNGGRTVDGDLDAGVDDNVLGRDRGLS